MLSGVSGSHCVLASYRRALWPADPSLAERRIVVLGDAAHSMSPQLGQGANLALQEAQELAAAVRSGRPLFEFQSRAARRAWYYGQLSTVLSPLFQSDPSWVGWIRDKFLPPIGRWGWVDRQMLRTFAGLAAQPEADES